MSRWLRDIREVWGALGRQQSAPEAIPANGSLTRTAAERLIDALVQEVRRCPLPVPGERNVVYAPAAVEVHGHPDAWNVGDPALASLDAAVTELVCQRDPREVLVPPQSYSRTAPGRGPALEGVIEIAPVPDPRCLKAAPRIRAATYVDLKRWPVLVDEATGRRRKLDFSDGDLTLDRALLSPFASLPLTIHRARGTLRRPGVLELRPRPGAVLVNGQAIRRPMALEQGAVIQIGHVRVTLDFERDWSGQLRRWEVR